MSSQEPPVIDFGPFYGTDPDAKSNLIEQIRHACEEFGFFQLINHNVPSTLQESVLSQAKDLFDLPIEIKEKYDKGKWLLSLRDQIQLTWTSDNGGFNRGYERLRAQNFEKRAKGDLKEGFYLGKDLPSDDPLVVAKRFGQGPNKYPVEVKNPNAFHSVMDEYHVAMTSLAISILRVLSWTLGLEESFFDAFCEHPVAALRLLHYPPQDPATADTERGIGAHTDFGAVTILLQDETGGLQVWSNRSSEWVDVTPRRGAYVVNLGNMMMRWTNDKYLSNLHRVINRSGKERFSVPFFFSGNPDYVVECLPSCLDPVDGANYPPIMVHDWMTGRFADTYGSSSGNGIGDLRSDVVDGMKS